MIRSALTAISGVALLLGACSDNGVINITAIRASTHETMTLIVCEANQNDCGNISGTGNPLPASNTINVFNSSDDKAVIAINVGNHTVDGVKPTNLTMLFSVANDDIGSSDGGCFATMIPVRPFDFTATIDNNLNLTLSCAPSDASTGTCALVPCSVYTSGIIVDASAGDFSTADGGI